MLESGRGLSEATTVAGFPDVLKSGKTKDYSGGFAILIPTLADLAPLAVKSSLFLTKCIWFWIYGKDRLFSYMFKGDGLYGYS